MKSKVIILFSILLVCSLIGFNLDSPGYYVGYVLNGVTGLTILFGVALLCFPQKENVDMCKTSGNIPNLKKYKLVAGVKSTNSQLFASDQVAWDMLRGQLQGVSLGCAILYVYGREKFPVVDKNMDSLQLSEGADDTSVVDYWKPVCVGVLAEAVTLSK